MYNTFNSPNLCNTSPFELVFGRKPRILLDLETDPDMKVSGTYKEYYDLLRKRIGYLHKLLQDFKLKCLSLLNQGWSIFNIIVEI